MDEPKKRSVAALTSNQVILTQAGMAGFFILVAIYMSPPLTQQLSRLPVVGVVNEAVLTQTVDVSPQTLPAAIAIPKNTGSKQDVDLALLDEIFLPPPVESTVDLKGEAQERAMQLLGSLQVDAVSSVGAFINGAFYPNGTPLGLTVPGPDGRDHPVFAHASGSTVTLRSGEYSRTVVIE